MKVPLIHIDFETYCELDIKEVGSWKYSEDPSIDLLCLAYRIGDGDVQIYRPYEGDPLPEDLFKAVEDGGILTAWNVFFEYSIWMNYCVPKLGWPVPASIQWKDAAAKAAAHALPLALDKCGKALALPPDLMKFASGKALLNLLASPQKDGRRITHDKARQKYAELYEYCIQDVVTESYIDELLLDLKQNEGDFWHIDQMINRRGIPIDIDSVIKINSRVREESRKANAEIPKLTGGKIERVTQVQRIVKFCQDSGIKIDNCQAKTIDKVLEYVTKHPEKVKDKHRNALKVLEYRKFFGKSAVSKYEKMIVCAGRDRRVRGTMVFRGAHTGRWAGRLIQPHNYFKPTINKRCDVDHFVECVANRPIDCVEAVYQPYIHAAASATRMMIAAPPGKTFFIGDYNAIEARGVMWLANDERGLQAWRSGRDIYCEMASKIFKFNVTKENEYERFIGKGIILGCGYGLGWRGFVNNMKDQWGVNIEESLAQEGVSAFRETHPLVVKLWNKTEEAALQAVRYPNRVFRYNHLAFYKPKDRDFLYMLLPSGRLLAYPYPKIENKRLPWGVYKDQLTFKAMIDNHWRRTHTYGGSTIENADQGVCCEIMGDGIVNCEMNAFPVTFTIHDELILELDRERAIEKARTIHRILETSPVWAPNFPLKVEYDISSRFKK
jgi:DNA polymerase